MIGGSDTGWGRRLPAVALATFIVALLVGVIAAWPGLADALLRIDEQLYLAVRGSGPRPAGPPELVEIVRDVTALGGYTVTGLVTAVSLLMLLATGRRREAVFVAATIASGVVAVALLKELIARPRPDLLDHAAHVATLSFPSGHAAKATMVYLTLALVLADTARSHRLALVGGLTAAGVILAVGLSRIYLGVHWPSDVVAGWTLGLLWVLWARAVAPGDVRPTRSRPQPRSPAAEPPA